MPVHRLCEHPQQAYLRERQERGICYQCSENYHWAGMLGVDLCHTCQIHFPKKPRKQWKRLPPFQLKRSCGSQCHTACQPALTAEVLPELSWRKAAELAMGKQRFSHQWWVLAAKKCPKCVPAASTGWAHGRYTQAQAPSFAAAHCTLTPPEMPTEPYSDSTSSPLNISTLLFCLIQQEENNPEVTGFTCSSCLHVKSVLLAAASTEAA